MEPSLARSYSASVWALVRCLTTHSEKDFTVTDHINRLLTDFGNTLGLDSLTLDEEGYCCLKFDDLMVNFERVNEEDALLLVYAPLGQMPENAPASVYAQLLQANYFFVGTGGGTLGLSEDGNVVALVQILDISRMEVLGLEEVLQNFVNAADIWSQYLVTDGREELQVRASDLINPMFSGMIRG